VANATGAQHVPAPGLIHGFVGFLGVVDAAEATVATILDRLSQMLPGWRPVSRADRGGRPG